MSSTAENQRVNFASIKNQFPYPDFLEVQLKSFQDFLQLDTPPEKRKKEGLYKVFAENFPIADTRNNFVLEFLDYYIDPPRYCIDECIARGLTYSVPLKAKLKLYCTDPDHEDFDTVIQDVYLGPIPYMTDRGTFVINGAERVIVSQLVRSPGIYYGIAHDKVGKKLYSCTVIPNRGAWLEYETDSNDVFYVRVDRTRKVPITVLIRALGIGTNQEIVDLFGEEPKILASFGKDVATNYEEGLLELYKKIRPGEPLTVESAESLISAMFFDPRRYDLAKVGRYKFNKKLMLKNRINGHVLAEDVVNLATGEIIAEAGTEVTRSLADDIQNAAVPYVWIQTETRNVKVLSSMMVDLRAYVDCNPKDLGITELVYYPVLAQLMEEHTDIDDLKEAIKKNVHDLIPKHITKDDIFASSN